MYKLYGSTTSPYVRRLRIWMANMPHEFVNLKIFERKDRELLARHNPTLKVPMLEDESEIIFDSRVIFRYLSDKHAFPLPSWEQENQLTLIDAANDSFVNILLLQRTGFDTKQDGMYFRLQKERVDATLQHLNDLVEAGCFKNWNYLAICLFCLVDWIEFRTLHDLSGFDALRQFRQDNAQRIEVTATDPRS